MVVTTRSVAAKKNNQRNNYAKRRQKIPFKKVKGNGVKLHEAVVKQNIFRARMRTIGKKLSLTPVREIGTGTDYKAILRRGKQTKKILIDIKFSFGSLGEGVIAARINERRLINQADYAFAISRDNKIHVFPIKQLSEYVSRNFGQLPNKERIDRGTHFVYPIKLKEFYSAMKIEPTIVELSVNGVKSALTKLTTKEIPAERTTNNNSFRIELTKKMNPNLKNHINHINNHVNNSTNHIRQGVRGR